jgi:hypothetical protein
MFGWIPIIGPIIDGIVSMFNKIQDKDIVKIKTDGTVDIASIKAAQEVTSSFKDDIGVRLARDIIMFPGSIWCGIYIWDKIMALRYPDLVWGVASLDGPMFMLPYALLTFFFGMSLKSMIGRR